MLLFDEAEDLFAPRLSPHERGVAGSRVFIHRLLEQMRLPTIWTANDIDGLGAAVLRRMTLCMELKVPAAPVRRALWRTLAAGEGITLGEANAHRLARLVPAAPAVAATALRATRLAQGDAQTACTIVEGIARAIAGGRLPAPAMQADANYDLGLVNTDTDLPALLDRLALAGAPRAVSLLLSGRPGTGKSELARHIAGRMGLEVMHRRASDLLGPYVGQTEQQIANAFAEARDASAFLIFDEADSLLGDRSRARQGWEVSQVNEMLRASLSRSFVRVNRLPARAPGPELATRPQTGTEASADHSPRGRPPRCRRSVRQLPPIQLRTAFAMNSGPLSTERGPDTPQNKQVGEHASTSVAFRRRAM